MTLISITPHLRTQLRHSLRLQRQALVLWSLPMSGFSRSHHGIRTNRVRIVTCSELQPRLPQQSLLHVLVSCQLARVIMLLRFYYMQFLAMSLLLAFLRVAIAAWSNLPRTLQTKLEHLSKIPKFRNPWQIANAKALMRIPHREPHRLVHAWRSLPGGVHSAFHLLCHHGIRMSSRCVLLSVLHRMFLLRLNLQLPCPRHPRHPP